MNILIVDDSAPVRRMIRSLVASFSAEVFECADGSQAFAAYQRHQPDWVLMDVEMELTDGITATRQIRRIDPQAQICIVTNYDDADLREEARNAGACAYIVKDDLHLLRALLTEPFREDEKNN